MRRFSVGLEFGFAVYVEARRAEQRVWTHRQLNGLAGDPRAPKAVSSPRRERVETTPGEPRPWGSLDPAWGRAGWEFWRSRAKA